MTSHAPRKCCTTGVKHEGAATGEMKSIGSTSTYFAYPEDKSTDHAVLILTDVFGHVHNNAKLIADQFAANGYFVVMPDLFHGDPIPWPRPEGHDVMKWLNGPPGHLQDRVDPVIIETIKEMRSKHGVKKIGVVGYCFGGKYVARFTGETGRAAGASCDAGYTAHPSFMSPEELKSITGPLSIAAAEHDEIFPEENRKDTERLLREMLQKDKNFNYQVMLYGGVSHGFGCRADVNDPRQKLAKEQAFIQAVQWFDEYVKGSKL